MKSKYKIIKNLTSLAFGHFLVFTAFDSLSNLQSTVNESGGVGVASQSVIYACFTISSFFLPTYLIKRFGCKKTLLISVFSVCPYVAANMYPIWGTLMPSAVLSGLAFGPLWAARSTYVNELSFQYSRFTKASISVINAWFFGIYSFFHENAEIWGNVLSYYVLKENNNGTEIAVPEETLLQCGVNFCGKSSEDVNPNLNPPSYNQWYTLTGIYLGFIVLAGFVIMFAVDPLEENSSEEDNKEGKQKTKLSASLLVATLKHMKDRDQLLLIPLSFYCGLADGFYNSDFTKSYIACAWGISRVGHVTICYGVVSAIMDCSSGFLVKWIRRVPVFLLAASSHLMMLVTLLLWRPHNDNYTLYFILSGVYGIGASVWWSQIIAFYGVIFKENEEPAFSNFYFWSSLGFSVAYAYSDSLCTNVKIYILIVLLVFAIVAYTIVEYNNSDKKREARRNLNTPKVEQLVHVKDTEVTLLP
ncbi:UNC93-like protein [Nephila pilipes]|uniref:UNC93-like protein n=1 Tax=Nephila pilipes TaxID=299642 RepID=A0A8X6M6F8_NEPPI|nr:UNC93-like protein [Nephila pilipes]